MTKRVINEVQEYLTICGENRVYQIVNVHGSAICTKS